MLLLAQQSPAPAASETVYSSPTVKKVANPRAGTSGRSPLVVAAEKAKADRAKSAKSPVKIDQETLRTTTGKLIITNPREIPDRPAPAEVPESRPLTAQPPPARKAVTRDQLEEKLSTLRAQMARVTYDVESDTPQDGEEDELAQEQQKIQTEIDAIRKQLAATPQ